jgi:hypothetical protein
MKASYLFMFVLLYEFLLTLQVYVNKLDMHGQININYTLYLLIRIIYLSIHIFLCFTM